MAHTQAQPPESWQRPHTLLNIVRNLDLRRWQVVMEFDDERPVYVWVTRKP